jgi:hypothetical protein
VKPTLSIAGAISQFPATFGLRGFPGKTFRMSTDSSYVNGSEVILYTEVLSDGKWLSFAKGTVAELNREVIK